MHGSQISGSDLSPPATYVFNKVVMIGHRCPYSVSKPRLIVNFRVRPFSVTVRTPLSGAPAWTAF
jgi:hypothetical protein